MLSSRKGEQGREGDLWVSFAGGGGAQGAMESQGNRNLWHPELPFNSCAERQQGYKPKLRVMTEP